jgi:guanylate kinase
MWNDGEDAKTGSDRPSRTGRLIVISGPSGSGKSTLVRRLLTRPDLRLTVSVSATTRAPRAAEVHGRDYLFLTPGEFADIRGELLESAVVHEHHYGTPAGPVRRAIAEGLCVALVIDVQGGFQVRRKVPDALLVFIQVPSLEVLEARLRDRGTDSPETIERRLATARRELELASVYDVQVVNDNLESAVEQLAAILTQNGCGASDENDR